jgi:DNA-binding PadR family transcriptional regulator
MVVGNVREQASAPMHSTVNWALLGLVIERPSYAYELAHRFERTYEGALSLSSVSHVYTALATLRERGLVQEAAGAQGSAPRSRRRYEPTALGLSEHAHWLVEQVSEERRRQRLIVQQLGALARSPARALQTLDAYERACLAEVAAATPAGSEQGPGTTRLVARLIGEETRLAIAARLEWVQYARTQLHALPDRVLPDATTGPTGEPST